MTRQYSAFANDDAKRLLKVIADKSTAPKAYKQTMIHLGQYLGAAMLEGMVDSHNMDAYLVATVEDADFLALGVLQTLETQLNSLGFACFWNERKSLFNLSALAVSPILKQYQEPAERVDYLILVKSIISSGCVVRTNLQNLIQRIQPSQIFIAAPVMYYNAEESLRQSFNPDIANKFQFYYLAQDQQRTDEGEILPGIGGMVYDRLGFRGQAEKNRYTPNIVKQRRQKILQRRKANA